MRKRSITDQETSLIKAMHNMGMKNKDIQFFFNRPGRAVNSGRITDIMSGGYSDSSTISPASQADATAFLKANPAPGGQLPIVALSEQLHPVSPIALPLLLSLFEEAKPNDWRFKIGESDQHECKENFGFKHSDKWLRAVAALANNKGGYVLFGVRDKTIVDGKISDDSYKVTGLANDEFVNADPAHFTKKIKSTFDPTPRVESAVITVAGVKIGVFYVHQHPSRPVIATKQEDSIKEGDIFFRYSGQSTRIKYSDLRAVLDDRDKSAREQLIPLVAKLVALGPENAMIADLTGGALSDGQRSIVIEEGLLDKIKFIRQGEFDEVKGEIALRLVGDVTATNSTTKLIHRAFVTPADLINDFLNLRSPSDPCEYIRCAVEGGNGAWQPMHYYASKAGMTKDALANFILNTAATKKRRELYADRALGKTSAYLKQGGKPAAITDQLMVGKAPAIANVYDAGCVARAFACLLQKPDLPLEDVLGILQKCCEQLQGDAAMSAVRRGISRVDELFFCT